MSNPLSVAIKAAQTAGDYVKSAANNKGTLVIEQKQPQDYVSQVDRQSEQIIREILTDQFPRYPIVGEELGGRLSNSRAPYWVVDPLDGTTNFLRGVPHYAISIALVEHGSIVVGVVLDITKQELFSSQKGQGAFVNGERLAVSTKKNMTGALLATGVPFSGQNLLALQSFTSCMSSLLQCQTSGIRRLGAAALDLAYVAAGRYDGYWEASLKPWDIAAGILLVSEAGGQFSDFNGGKNCLDTGDIIAAPPAVFADMAPIVKSSYQSRVTTL